MDKWELPIFTNNSTAIINDTHSNGLENNELMDDGNGGDVQSHAKKYATSFEELINQARSKLPQKQSHVKIQGIPDEQPQDPLLANTINNSNSKLNGSQTSQ